MMDITPNEMTYRLFIFTAIEALLLVLNLIFMILIIVYLKKIGYSNSDPYILSSFLFLSVALMMRSIINFVNYGIGFEYISGITQNTSEIRFEQWYMENHSGLNLISIELYLAAVLIRNIGFIVNLARWVITLNTMKY